MSHESGSTLGSLSLHVSPQIIAGIAIVLVILLILLKLKGGDSSGYSHRDSGGLKTKILKYGIILVPVAVLAARFTGLI